ncbi:MAG: chitin disaccharide deacetylase [Defluviitaleaceae bacterium]|nr:chitin disaccharide deacetylase [Defluviitaleaceae bacterium]
MKIIFNADDFGYSKGINLGIIEAYENGLVRSATIMANMPCFDHAVSVWKASSGLKVGVHLVLTTGKSLGSGYKTITDEAGNFLNHEDLRQRPIDPAEVEKEFTLQVEKVLAAGIPITHIDGHHHIQNFCGITDVFINTAKKYNVAVRAFDKSLPSVDCAGIAAPAFAGTFFGDNVTLSHLEHILSSCTETTEIMCHPAFVDSFLYDSSSYNITRAKELELLTSPAAKKLIEKYGHTLSSFSDI